MSSKESEGMELSPDETKVEAESELEYEVEAEDEQGQGQGQDQGQGEEGQDEDEREGAAAEGGNVSAPGSRQITATAAAAASSLLTFIIPPLSVARTLRHVSMERALDAHPMVLFAHQISSDSAETKVDAARRLGVVARASGLDDTLRTLLPWIGSRVPGLASEGGVDVGVGMGMMMPDHGLGHDNLTGAETGTGAGADADVIAEMWDIGDPAPPPSAAVDDEVLLALALELGQLVPSLVPASKCLPVLSLLERLCGAEETVVRDGASRSFDSIVPLLSTERALEEAHDADLEFKSKMIAVDDDEAEAEADTGRGGAMPLSHRSNFAPSYLLSAARRMSQADWFTSKVSACSILPEIYRYYNARARFKRRGGAKSYASLSSLTNDAKGAEDGGVHGTHDNDIENDDHHHHHHHGHHGHHPSDDEARRELRRLYRDLVDDDAPMVRRSAGKNVGRFAEAVADLPPDVTATKPSSTSFSMKDLPVRFLDEDDNVDERKKKKESIIKTEMVPLFGKLGNDDRDSVRLYGPSMCGSLALALGGDPESTSLFAWPIALGGARDLSWRVRLNLAKEFATVVGCMGFGSDSKFSSHQVEAFTAFAGLLQDHEAEVRAFAVESIARMTQLGGPDLFSSHISPVLPLLADDPVMEVRSKLAQTLMDCCDDSICTALSDHLILQDFKPLLEGFLNDEFAEVQLHVLTKLSRVSRLLAKMDAVVGSILAMTKAQNWRVREAVGRLLPFLAEARGVGFFEDHLMEPWLKLLLDQVADVRSSCVSGMPKLLSVAGAGWIQKEILPQYQRIYDDSSSYLTRITILRSFAALASADPDASPEKQEDGGSNVNIPSDLLEDVVGLMLRGLNDRVPNVRMVSARGFALMTAPCEEALIQAKVKPALSERTMEDEDADCRFYSQLALDTSCA